MVTLPMKKFYDLSEENQRTVTECIHKEYIRLPNKAQPVYQHFVAQYLLLSLSERMKINHMVETFYQTDGPRFRHYAAYNSYTNYGISEIKKIPHLFSPLFVAYETPLELGLKGKLRFRVDCSSRVTAEQLRDDMNSAFLAKAIKLKPSSKVIGINFSSCMRVSDTQVKLLQEMLSDCRSNLFVDLCDDNAIKLKNPWNAIMIMSRDNPKGATTYKGDRTVVDNFLRKVNSFF